MNNLIIRNAKREDVKSIYTLINALAKFEKEEHAVQITVEELAEDGFGENPSYSCIVAELEGRVIGFALYFIRYSTWQGKTVYLEDFLVDENYRSKGIGKLLFEEMISIAQNLNVRQMSWQVLDWNEGAIRFYKKYEAEFADEWLNVRILFDKK
jgi:GNAT superfamily N-acetyltransferase